MARDPGSHYWTPDFLRARMDITFLFRTSFRGIWNRMRENHLWTHLPMGFQGVPAKNSVGVISKAHAGWRLYVDIFNSNRLRSHGGKYRFRRALLRIFSVDNQSQRVQKINPTPKNKIIAWPILMAPL